MEANQKHILSEEDRVLELMERGSLADKAALDALRDDEQLRRACMDVLELTSCCRRREEKPDVEAALRRFHQHHVAHRVALKPRSSRRRWWAVAAAVLVLVGVSALLLPQLSRQSPLAEQSATQLYRQPVLLADGGREAPVGMESAFKPVVLAAPPKAAGEVPVKMLTAKVGAGENSVVTLPDGSRVYLYPQSSFSFPSRFDGE